MLLVALPAFALVAALLVGCLRPGGEASVDAEVIAVGDTTPTAEAEEEERAFAPETSGDGVDTEEGASGSSSSMPDSDAAASAPAVAGSDAWAPPRPEDLSTGPLLAWQEIEPPGPGLYALESTSDGRVVAWSHFAEGDEHAYVTGDGTHWDAVRLPDGIQPRALAVADDRWAVIGWVASDAAVSPLSLLASGPRTFLSEDQGATWTDLQLRGSEAERPLPEYVSAVYNPTALALDGGTIVVATVYGRFLDVPTLLADRGLVPSGETVVDWWTEEDALHMRFADDSEGSGIEPGQAAIDGDLRVLLADLGLTPEQRELLDPDAVGPETVIFAGEGANLAQVASYEDWVAVDAEGDGGFMLMMFDPGAPTARLMTSPDGRTWKPHPSAATDWAFGATMPTLADGVIWEAAAQTGGVTVSISRARIGELAQEVASFTGVQGLNGFEAGPAGLAASAALVPPRDGYASGAGALVPTGRIVKDGYELRFNEPADGMTLWDLASDEAVYVFGPEILQGDVPPDGVRQEGEGDEVEIGFDDPETGDLLVVFTAEDLAPLLASMMEAEAGELADDWPEMWVGWSADGSAWGWQTAADAFDVDGLPSIAGLAVGTDFVVAVVQDIEPTQALGQAASSEAADPWAGFRTRWYVAPTP